MKTDGDAAEGADVRVEVEGVTDGELPTDSGGGSAEATGVEAASVDSEAEVAAVPVTVPTVRVKLAVTKEWLELDVGAVSTTV